MNKYVEVYCENGHINRILESSYRKYKESKVHKCKECLTDRRNQEAISAGITLLEHAEKDYGLYKLSCGCITKIKYCHVKINNFICATCRDSNQKLKEDSFGLVAIERLDYKVTKYHRKECGHILEMNRDCLSNFCKVCQEEKFVKEAEENGLEIISKSEKGYRYRVYKFKDCGHIQTFAHCNVKIGNFKCQQCHAEKLEEEANAVGLTLIRKSQSNHSRLYRASCGHILDIQTSAVRHNQWTCHICKDTYILKPNNIYLLEISSSTDGFNFLKLGFSKSIEQRIRSYKLDNCSVNILSTAPVKSGKIAHKIEYGIHSKYVDYNLDHNLMRKYFLVSGFTECYDIKLKDSLLKEIENIKEELNA